jgi:hypothetical protein
LNARPATRLALLFGVIYFVQGIGEPTEGLIAQPTRSLLRSWGLGADEIAFAYMLTTLAQLDLAARYCPAASAGTVFALLMSLSNLSLSLASRAGGGWYETWTASVGAGRAFDTLVVIGAICTAACWLVVRWLPKSSPHL